MKTEKSVSVGEVEIVALTDTEGPYFELGGLFPGVGDGEWEPYLRRYPWAFADAHTALGRIGAYLLRSPDLTVLVDAGFGPGAAFGMQGNLLDDLSDAGARPEDVDVVFLTHLHADRLGWTITASGDPTFSEARYVTQAAGWEALAPRARRSLAPFEDLGVLDLLQGEEPLADEFAAVPTPGHFPGHTSLLVSSGREQAIIVGNVLVHPAQATEFTWNSVFDRDKEQAAHTRGMLLEWIEAEGILVAAGQFPGTGFGHIVREDGGRRHWQPLGETVAGGAPASRAKKEKTYGSKTG